MHNARRIAQLPRAEWQACVAALPDSCAYEDCGVPRNCRERIADYLRMQWRIAKGRATA